MKFKRRHRYRIKISSNPLKFLILIHFLYKSNLNYYKILRFYQKSLQHRHKKLIKPAKVRWNKIKKVIYIKRNLILHLVVPTVLPLIHHLIHPLWKNEKMIVGAEMIADEETIVDEEMIVVLTTEKGESIKIINRVDQDKNHILKAKTA